MPENPANAGGVVVSSFEWVRDLEALCRDAGWSVATGRQVCPRLAASMLAVGRVASATRHRGIAP